ncbi:MAG: cation:proton antiporter [Chitinophagales bacterium]|nr:cation:proton antiporter [Chitinophagales bacterium]
MEHLPGLIKDLALILIVAAFVTLIFKKIKQPVVLGYIIAGFFVGPHLSLVPTVTDTENVETLAHLGVIFLLFSLGLEFSFKKLVKVGSTAAITALTEIIVIVIAGYYAGRWMGWSFMDSIFLGGMLASSSTTIIVKAFDELGMKTKHFASVVFGVLIIEDIVVIMLMVLLSTIAVTRDFQGIEMLGILGKLLFFPIIWFLGGIFLIPTLFKRTAKFLDDETLLVLAVGLCLGMVVVAVSVGFSAELGAFIMGSILAETTSAERIEKIFNPVRDLFASVFFVSVGMLIDPNTIIEYKWAVLIVTLLTLVVKFLGTTLGAVLSGQPLKQSVHVGMSMAQIGEFAFIVATLGLSLGVISPFLFPIAVGASAITTFTTPYMIKYSDPFYDYLDKKIPNSIKTMIQNYAINIQRLQTERQWKTVLFAYIKILSINGIVLIALNLLTVEILAPFLDKQISNHTISRIITTIISLIAAAPFIWAFIGKRPSKVVYKELWLYEKYGMAPLMIIRLIRLILGIIIIGFWIDTIFTGEGIFIALPVFVLLLVFFPKKIQNRYYRIEKRFLDNLNKRELAAKQAEKQNNADTFIGEENDFLWDAHMVNLEVDPLATYIGRYFKELQWREKYGINIAYIKRGDKIIYAPNRDNRLLPFDKIGIIATDEQLEVFEPIFNEKEVVAKHEEAQHDDVILYKLKIEDHHLLNNKTIAESKICERTNSLILGVERNNHNVLHPKRDFKFQNNDIVWIVGERKKILSLKKAISNQ